MVIITLITITLIAKNNLNNLYNYSNNSNNSNIEKQSDFLKIAECFTQEDIKNCLDNFVAGYAIDAKTTKELLNAMEVARTQDAGIENECHNIAHAIGRYTFKKYNNIGDAFNACDQSCHSGCYHGVMERMFYSDNELSSKTHLTYADIEDKIPNICAAKNFSDPSPSVIFQCLHGVGHAIMFSLVYNLEDSLKACDLLPTEYDQTSCYGGVFMENVTAFDKKLRDLKSSDYLYPCNKVDTKYKHSCYLMQTSVMFEFGLTAVEIIDQCQKSELPGTCFISLGRDLSNYVRTDNIEYVRNTCESVTGEYAMSCINGTVYALIDNTWDGQFALKFCQTLQKNENKSSCYRSSLGYLKNVYQKTNEQIALECQKFAGEESEFCNQNSLSL